MKIKNDSSSFELKYDNKNYTIPSGELEIADDAFGTFIVRKARNWGLKVTKIGSSEKFDVKPIEELKEIEVIVEATKEDEKVEEVVVEVPTKKTKK